MFIHSIMEQRLAPQPKKWNHAVNRRTPIVVLALKAPTQKEWHNSVYLQVDGVACFFMLMNTSEGLVFSYSLEAFHRGGLTQEEGEFTNFDSVSAVFGGLRFHWSLESEKVVVSDALAGRRDFDTLTIE